jgi:hypothetical protein
MLHNTCLLLILAGVSATPSDGHPTDTIPVYRCDFSPESDANYNDWPDGWTRRTGREYPAYVKIGIRDDRSPGGPHLAIQLDGGAATAYSPPIPAR